MLTRSKMIKNLCFKYDLKKCNDNLYKINLENENIVYIDLNQNQKNIVGIFLNNNDIGISYNLMDENCYQDICYYIDQKMNSKKYDDFKL